MIKTVCIVGAGMMGRQIALHTARYGYEVYVSDSNADVCAAAQTGAAGVIIGKALYEGAFDLAEALTLQEEK